MSGHGAAVIRSAPPMPGRALNVRTAIPADLRFAAIVMTSGSRRSSGTAITKFAADGKTR